MPAPTGVTISGTAVIIQVTDINSAAFTSRDGGVFFGEIVLRGSGATTYSDGDLVVGKNCTQFQEPSTGYSFAILDQSDILLLYTPL